jgi:chromosomal replication initiator protein
MSILSSLRREDLLEELAALLDPAFFETWCRGLELRETPEDALEVAVPRFGRALIEPRLRPALVQALEKLTGAAPRIEFRSDDGETEPLEAPPIPVSSARPESFSGFPLQDHYTFDTFIEGPTNRVAKAAGMQVAQPPFQYNLFVYGKSGVGKTHLLHAVCHHAQQVRPGLRIAYLPCEEFLGTFVQAMRANTTDDFRKRFRGMDLLAIDDIHKLADKDATQNEFFHLFNHLFSHNKQMVFSSDTPPSRIPSFKEHLSSRLESGLVVEIQPPTFEMRMAIVEAKAEGKGARLPEEVARFVAETIPDNVRELEGAVVKVIAMSSLMGGRTIDLAVAREALKHRIEPARRGFDVQDVCRLVAARFGIEAAELLSKSRSPRVTRARQLCISLCRALQRSTFRELARAFGASAPNSITHALKKSQEAMKQDPGLRQTYEQLLRQAEQMMRMFPPAG